MQVLGGLGVYKYTIGEQLKGDIGQTTIIGETFDCKEPVHRKYFSH